MIPVKTALSVSVILASAGLAGCQTTEERVYYSSAPVATSATYVYEDGPYVRRPPVVVGYEPPVRYVRPPMHPPRYWGGPDPRRHYYGGPVPDPRRHYYGGPVPDPRRWHRHPGRGFVPMNNGNSSGYDTQ